jgi:uncharacterized protein YfbU (UPF0304 family)
MKLGDGEKLILIMLSEIHEHLGIRDGVDPKFVRSAIYSGNTWGLRWKYPNIFDNVEIDHAVVSEVVHILDMWSFIESSYQRLSAEDKARIEAEAVPFGKDVQFTGFDGNNEGEYVGAARFLIEKLDRFSNFKGRDLDSHVPMSLDANRRMHAVFGPMRASLADKSLDAIQIMQILQAMIQPPRAGGETE